MLGYVLKVQRKEIREGIACVRHRNMAGSGIGDGHKEYFAGAAALKAGGAIAGGFQFFDSRHVIV
jgi:isocitrate lyase